ncbi:hypothetical protein KDW_18330 [Dictyobacter vulcani]|uniref:Uncharacterized protein n=1 Tax=Dictyobacter vulcani TaxID=2607529 RepID=A0A5J4KMY1_9CHLR|nr:helix-turn-helix domain-containing protein [Dictyobacter vulcani]GER87671.1 hypothetical protein KDW_18330 [Dictyobacter vulcani]
MGSNFYSLEEAIAKLGKSRSTFIREVNSGLIPYHLEKGKRRGKVYPKIAIDALAEIEEEKKPKTHLPKIDFSSSTPADMWQEIQIGIQLYGEDDIVPYKKILQWREINDEMHMSVKDEGNQVVAYSCLMPLNEEIMLPLLRDEIRERDIPNDSIRQWTDPGLSVYVSSATVKPTGDINKDSRYGRYLLTKTIKWALNLNRQYDIKNWYGIGATKEGQSLFERLGFSEVVSVHNGERKGYVLQNTRRPVKIINSFLKEIQ